MPTMAKLLADETARCSHWEQRARSAERAIYDFWKAIQADDADWSAAEERLFQACPAIRGARTRGVTA